MFIRRCLTKARGIALASWLAAAAVSVGWTDVPSSAGDKRPRAREIGLSFGIFQPGPLNAITDVTGVRVGHRTIVVGQGIRTGVTAILPHPGNIFQEKLPAAVEVGNGFGKLTGSTQIDELGTLETPIVLTNTLSVFTAADALIEWTLSRKGNESVRSVNPLAAETNDGYLNDIRKRHVTREDVLNAIAAARGGPVKEGCVGAGTGTRCLGWKGGIGTSSRRLPTSLGGHTVGVLVQTNFGGILTIAGAPVGKELGRYYLSDVVNAETPDGGSCVIVVATDAPLDARQLGRVAKRALLGLAAVGSPMTHGSGDYVIAFSVAKTARPGRGSATQPQSRPLLADEAISPLFQATHEATEEAIVNSLLAATTITGFRGRTTEAIPVDRVIDICKRYGAIRP